MDWNMVWTIVGINAGLIAVSLTIMITLFLWSRSETTAQILEMRQEFNGFQQRWAEESRTFQQRWAEESRNFRDHWAAESKDFHGRLISLEERSKK